MASVSGENESGLPPIRSILKKVSSDGAMSGSNPRGKKISFDTSLTLQWAQQDSKLESLKESGNGEAGGAVGVASNGEPSPFSSSVEVRGGLEVADGNEEPGKPLKSSSFKKAIKTRVGSVLRGRSSRTHVLEGVADLEASGSGLSAENNRHEAGRRVSDMSASAEYPSGRSHGLPRLRSLDSGDLFSRSNKSLRSRIAKFGKHFKPDFHKESADDALPVLTKITPLGGFGWG